MKRNIVWMLFFVAMLSLSLAAAAKDHEEIDGYKCSTSKVAGTWGYSETGTMIINEVLAGALGFTEGAGPYPYASVGSYTLDRYGNLSGERTGSLGGIIMKATIEGMATANPDCTGTLMLSFYDPLGNPAGEAAKDVVYVDNAREAHMIITSISHPIGAFNPITAVLATNAKKMSPGNSDK